MLMQIVGIRGLAGSGKSTVATHLVDKYRYVEIALADPFKRFLRDTTNTPDLYWWGPSYKRSELLPDPWGKHSARTLLQSLGTEWGRTQHEDIWVMRLRQEVAHLSRPGTAYRAYTPEKGTHLADSYREPYAGVVVPDVRYDNEQRAIEKSGGVVLWVVRPGAAGSEDWRLHTSELSNSNGPPPGAHVVYNDGTLEELPGKVDALLRRVSIAVAGD